MAFKSSIVSVLVGVLLAGFAGSVDSTLGNPYLFQNMPFAARLYLQALDATPPEHHRLAAELDMKPRDVFRHLDAPRLRAETPGLAALVFLLCFISFAIVCVPNVESSV